MEAIVFTIGFFIFFVFIFTVPFALYHYAAKLLGKKVKKLEPMVKARYVITLLLLLIGFGEFVFLEMSEQNQKNEERKKLQLTIPNIEFPKDSVVLPEFQKYELENSYDGLKIYFEEGTKIDGFLCDTSHRIYVNEVNGTLAECTLDANNTIDGFTIPKGFEIVERARSYSYKYDRENIVDEHYWWELSDSSYKGIKFNGVLYDSITLRITKEKEIVYFRGNRAIEEWNDKQMRKLLEK